jgi:hypothetical protein
MKHPRPGPGILSKNELNILSSGCSNGLTIIITIITITTIIISII